MHGEVSSISDHPQYQSERIDWLISPKFIVLVTLKWHEQVKRLNPFSELRLALEKGITFLTVIVSDPVSEDRHLNGALDTNSQNAIGIEHQG